MMSLTVMSTVVVALPPVLVAVTVYVVNVDKTVGTPLILPVAELILNPFGSAGSIDHVTTGPPCTVGVTAFIGEPLVITNQSGL